MKNLCVSVLSPFLLVFSFLLASCGGEDPNDPGNRLSGILSGDVELVDEYGLKLADYSGVSVSVEGTSYTTTTNSEGYWRFDELPAGTYILKFTREGFAENRLYNLQFVGGGHYFIGKTRLLRLPTFSISSLNAYVTDTTHDHYRTTTGDTIMTDTGKVVINRRDTIGTVIRQSVRRIVFSGEIDQPIPADREGTIAIAIGTNASVSKENGRFREIFLAKVYRPTNTFYLTMGLGDLEQYSFGAGSVLYAVAYPSAATGNSFISNDPEHRERVAVYLAPRPSAVVEVGL